MSKREPVIVESQLLGQKHVGRCVTAWQAAVEAAKREPCSLTRIRDRGKDPWLLGFVDQSWTEGSLDWRAGSSSVSIGSKRSHRDPENLTRKDENKLSA